MKIREILGLVLRYALGCVVAFLSLPTVVLGGFDVSKWLQLQFGEPYYGNRNYLETGLPVMLFGLGTLALTGYITLRRKVSLQWLFIPFVLSILASVAIPSVISGRTHQGRVLADLRYLTSAVIERGKEHGRFPQNQGELERATESWEGIKRGEKILSPYARRGQAVPYRFVYVGETSGPYLPPVIPQEPGVVYYAVSPDAHKFWLTATVLEQEVSTSVVLLPEEGGHLNVIEGSLEARPE